MSKQREALQLALEALEDYQTNGTPFFKCDSAVAAIREALAESERPSWDGYKEDACSQHPEAPHGFDRDASQSAGRYVCACENWEPEDRGEQEPEQLQFPAYLRRMWTGEEVQRWIDEQGPLYTVPLYTAPSTRKPLTDDEILDVLGLDGYDSLAIENARAIERAHGISEP